MSKDIIPECGEIYLQLENKNKEQAEVLEKYTPQLKGVFEIYSFVKDGNQRLTFVIHPSLRCAGTRLNYTREQVVWTCFYAEFCWATRIPPIRADIILQLKPQF